MDTESIEGVSFVVRLLVKPERHQRTVERRRERITGPRVVVSGVGHRFVTRGVVNHPSSQVRQKAWTFALDTQERKEAILRIDARHWECQDDDRDTDEDDPDVQDGSTELVGCGSADNARNSKREGKDSKHGNRLSLRYLPSEWVNTSSRMAFAASAALARPSGV